MLRHVKEALLNLKQDNDSEWVLPTQNGTMLYEPKTLNRRWKEALKRAGLEYSVFYQTRHTFASLDDSC
nr:MAG TPA: Integrase [Caudoviricetes sp.]